MEPIASSNKQRAAFEAKFAEGRPFDWSSGEPKDSTGYSWQRELIGFQAATAAMEGRVRELEADNERFKEHNTVMRGIIDKGFASEHATARVEAMPCYRLWGFTERTATCIEMNEAGHVIRLCPRCAAIRKVEVE